MYLKEAFRYQNYLSELIDRAQAFLSSTQNVTKTTQNHLRSKANPEADDEVVETSVMDQVDYNANNVIDFLMYLVEEKEKLTAHINAVKRAYNLSIDSEIANNRVRQRAARVLTNLGRMRPSETVSRGYGYKFNAEGNQSQYVYDVKTVTTIDFDRNKVKGLAKKLTAAADEASAIIDKAMVELVVSYDPPFGVNDAFEDAIEQFLTNAN